MFTVALFVTLLSIQILQCYAVTSGLKIVHEPYQWNEDMKRLRITTPERGLVFKITIMNQGNEPLEIDHLYIFVRVKSNTRSFDFYKQINLDYLYLPPEENTHCFVDVNFGDGSAIGSYTAELTYSIDSFHSEKPIEPYPFEFRVVSEEIFQQEIQQNKEGTVVISPSIEINITWFGIALSIPFIILLLKKLKG